MSPKPDIEIDKEDNSLWITIDPKDYSLKNVIKASSYFLESCNVLVDGDPEMGLVVELRPTNPELLEKTSNEFKEILENINNIKNDKNNLFSEINFEKEVKIKNIKKLKNKTVEAVNELSKFGN